MRRFVILLTAAFCTGCAEVERAEPSDPVHNQRVYAAGDIVPGTLIVQIKDPKRADRTIHEIETISDVTFDRMLFDSVGLKIASFAVPDGRELELAEIIARLGNVKLAEPNRAGSYGAGQ